MAQMVRVTSEDCGFNPSRIPDLFSFLLLLCLHITFAYNQNQPTLFTSMVILIVSQELRLLGNKVRVILPDTEDWNVKLI